MRKETGDARSLLSPFPYRRIVWSKRRQGAGRGGVPSHNSGERVTIVAIAETVGAGAVLLLAVYGCVQGVRWAVLRLLSPPRSADSVWLLPLSGHREDVEYLVRTAAARRCWNAGCSGDVCVVDVGADEETRLLARHVCEQVAGVRFLESGELSAFLSEWAK